MELSYETIERILTDHYSHDRYFDTAAEYGEPGYSFSTFADTPLFVMGNYWCRCDKGPRRADGTADLHDLAYHHPRVWAQMGSQGVEFHWYDEWYVDHNTGKAWRTAPDSYGWQPSIVFGDGDYITPDDDPETWIEWATDEPTSRCIPRVVGIKLADHGFQSWGDRFENGWHPGQNADPAEIVKEMREELGADIDIAFSLDTVGQFDIGFSAWYRWMCDCSEEFGPCEDHCEVLVQRDGASSRTADDLAHTLIYDLIALAESENVGLIMDTRHYETLAWIEEGWDGAGWLDDADKSDALYDLARTVEGNALAAMDGVSVWHDDGYRITRLTGGPLRAM